MINKLMEIPSVIFTHVDKSQRSHFQYWQHQARLYQQRNVWIIYVQVALESPSTNWLASVSLQLISLDVPLYLALQFTDGQWWLTQSFEADWQYNNEQDKQRFLTQFTVAEWLEHDARKHTPTSLYTDGKVKRCIF